MMTISSKEQQAFVNCKTANSIWVKLAAQYLQNASASTHVLQARFFHYQFPKRHSMMSHITAAQQLKDLGSPTPQSQIMTKIVSTLPTAFRNFMTVRDNLPEAEKTMTQLITKLMNEQHRNVCKSPSSNPPTAGKDEPRNQEDLPRVEENELSSQTFSFCGWPGSPLLSESRESPLVCHKTHLIVSRRFRLRRRQRYSSLHLWFHRTRQSCTALLPQRWNTLQLVTPPKKSVCYTIQREANRRRHRSGIHPNRPSTRRVIHEINRGPSRQLFPDRINMASSVITLSIRYFTFLLSILISWLLGLRGSVDI
jgi:hypothetical protein